MHKNLRNSQEQLQEIKHVKFVEKIPPNYESQEDLVHSIITIMDEAMKPDFAGK